MCILNITPPKDNPEIIETPVMNEMVTNPSRAVADNFSHLTWDGILLILAGRRKMKYISLPLIVNIVKSTGIANIKSPLIQ